MEEGGKDGFCKTNTCSLMEPSTRPNRHFFQEKIIDLIVKFYDLWVGVGIDGFVNSKMTIIHRPA